MNEILVYGVSVINGNRYPIFECEKIMSKKEAEQWKQDLRNKYNKEFYLHYTQIGGSKYLPKNTIPINDMHSILNINKSSPVLSFEPLTAM